MTDTTGPDTTDPTVPETETPDSDASEAGRSEQEESDDSSASSSSEEEPSSSGKDDAGSGEGDAESGRNDSEAEEEAEEEGLQEMGLLDHLGELRTRLVRCAIAIGVGFCASYAFSEQIFDKLMEPMVKVFQKLAVKQNALPDDFFEKLRESMGSVLSKTDFPYMDKLDLFFEGLEKSMSSTLLTGHFQYTYPPEAFFTYIKVSLVAGFFLVSPYLFYQIWGFVAPGLYKEERKYIVPIAALSAIFFVSGSLFGYFVVFPFGFEFFSGFSNDNIQFIPKLSEYLSFCLKLLFAFGIVFELPLFIFFLARMGLVSSKGLRSKRKYAILIAFVLAAILTPPDPFTQSLMAGPLVILYEVGVWVAFFFGKKEDREAREEKKRRKAEARQRKLDEKQRRIDEKRRKKEEKKQRRARKKNKGKGKDEAEPDSVADSAADQDSEQVSESAPEQVAKQDAAPVADPGEEAASSDAAVPDDKSGKSDKS